MSAPTSKNEVTARKLASVISSLWTKIKSTFQTVANLRTQVAGGVRASSSASDTMYPSEKAVAKAVESASVSDRLYANQLWGGEFRNSLSPGDVYFIVQRNSFFGLIASAITVEYSTDGGQTWIDYELTDSQKVSLFSQYSTVLIYCGKNTHIHPGYTGSIVGTKDLTNDMVPDQRVRVTISCMKNATHKWLYARIRRFGIYVSTNSANVPASVGSKHCVISLRTSNNVSAGVDTWEVLGDYNVSGDGGWNSIPCGNDTAEGGKVFGNGSGQFQEIRMVFWSDGLSTNPGASQTGNLAVRNILAFSELIWECNGINPNMNKYGMPCTVYADTGVAVFSYGIKFTARKLKTNLARTADSTFDGSADQLNIPVTGTLPLGNGGTGATSAVGAEYNILSKARTDLSSSTIDNAYRFPFLTTSPSTSSGIIAGYRTALAVWTWIKGKLSSDSGVNISGNAATATTAQNYDTSTGTIQSALAGKSDTGHVHNTDANEVTNSAAAATLDVVTDTTEIVTTNTAGYGNSSTQDKKLYRRPIKSKLWPWIKGLLSSDTGVNVSGSSASCTGNAATASAAASGSALETAINGKAASSHTHKTDAADVTSDDTNLGDATDGMQFVTTYADNTGYSSQHKELYRRPGIKIWNWIKSKIDSYTGVVHTTGDETVQGLKTFSNTTTGNDLDINLQSVTNNGTYKMGVEIAASGRRGLWDYSGTGISGEGKWIIYKDTDNVVHVGDDSSQRSKVKIGGITLDFSGTVGTAENTLYIV